jgi:hypothetical protein
MKFAPAGHKPGSGAQPASPHPEVRGEAEPRRTRVHTLPSPSSFETPLARILRMRAGKHWDKAK